jgi:hypothetical protein
LPFATSSVYARYAALPYGATLAAASPVTDGHIAESAFCDVPSAATFRTLRLRGVGCGARVEGIREIRVEFEREPAFRKK